MEDINVWDENDSSKEIVLKDGSVEAGTLNQLIRCLINPPSVLEKEKVEFKSVFLTCYQSFTTPERLLNKLIQLYPFSVMCNTVLNIHLC